MITRSIRVQADRFVNPRACFVKNIEMSLGENRLYIGNNTCYDA